MLHLYRTSHSWRGTKPTLWHRGYSIVPSPRMCRPPLIGPLSARVHQRPCLPQPQGLASPTGVGLAGASPPSHPILHQGTQEISPGLPLRHGSAPNPPYPSLTATFRPNTTISNGIDPVLANWFPSYHSLIFFPNCRDNIRETPRVDLHNGRPRFLVAHWHCQPPQPATQNRCEARCRLHYYGAPCHVYVERSLSMGSRSPVLTSGAF